MRRRTIPCVMAFGLMSMGCAGVTDAARSTGYWTHQAVHDSRERHRNRRLADAAWTEVRGATASEDYADGFKDGFADHLYRATTQPPPMPPKRYRELRYQTAAGFRAGADWLAGFRHGLENARASGLREVVTGPSALRADPTGPAPPAEVVAPAVEMPAPVPPPSDDRLPPPRRIDPPPEDVKQPPEPAPVASVPWPSHTFQAGRYMGPLAALRVRVPVRTPDAMPAVAMDLEVVPIRSETPVTHAGPPLVGVSSAQAVLRGDPLRGAAVRVADPTRPGTGARPACEWTPVVAQSLVEATVWWTPAPPPAGTTIERNMRPAEVRSRPPTTGPWEAPR